MRIFLNTAAANFSKKKVRALLHNKPVIPHYCTVEQSSWCHALLVGFSLFSFSSLHLSLGPDLWLGQTRVIIIFATRHMYKQNQIMSFILVISWKREKLIDALESCHIELLCNRQKKTFKAKAAVMRYGEKKQLIVCFILAKN